MKFLRITLLVLGIVFMWWRLLEPYNLPYIAGHEHIIGLGLWLIVSILVVRDIINGWKIPPVERLFKSEMNDLSFLDQEIQFHLDKKLAPNKIVEILSVQHRLPSKKVYARVLEVIRQTEDQANVMITPIEIKAKQHIEPDSTAKPTAIDVPQDFDKKTDWEMMPEEERNKPPGFK